VWRLNGMNNFLNGIFRDFFNMFWHWVSHKSYDKMFDCPHSTNSFVPTCDKDLHLHFGILHSMERRIAICVSFNTSTL
jgi:hypothetical protein